VSTEAFAGKSQLQRHIATTHLFSWYLEKAEMDLLWDN
jgi:Ulp1 family protease